MPSHYGSRIARRQISNKGLQPIEAIFLPSIFLPNEAPEQWQKYFEAEKFAQIQCTIDVIGCVDRDHDKLVIPIVPANRILPKIQQALLMWL